MADYQPAMRMRMRKGSRGRQKIEIKRIEKLSSRQVAFSKRRNGLFKKAAELSVICGAEVAIVALSATEKPFSFGNPSAEVVINRFLADYNASPRQFSSCSYNTTTTRLVHEMKEQYEEANKVLEEEKEKGEKREKAARDDDDDDHGSLYLWELPMENMSLAELDAYKEALVEMRRNVIVRANELANMPEIINNNNNFSSVDASPPYFNASNNTRVVSSSSDAAGNLGGFEDYNLGNENECSCSYNSNTTTTTTTTDFLYQNLMKYQEPPLDGFIKFA